MNRLFNDTWVAALLCRYMATHVDVADFLAWCDETMRKDRADGGWDVDKAVVAIGKDFEKWKRFAKNPERGF